MSRLDHRLEPEGEIRRFEAINGAMGWRRWSAVDRTRILDETFVPGAVVSAVVTLPAFVPAVIAQPAVVMPEVVPSRSPRARRRAKKRRAAAIEIDVAGVKVTIENGATRATIAAVIGALKGGS